MLAGPRIDSAAWRSVLNFELPDYSGGRRTRLPAQRLVIYSAKAED
ncbi:hypothetical protein [Azohydromonas australica]|nr:hypothetical protein [Azohydromonas australica]